MTKIFESPDHGKTVYSREFGNSEKTLYYRDKEMQAWLDSMKEEKLWAEIFKAAETNKALQDALDRVKILYHLGKEDGTE